MPEGETVSPCLLQSERAVNRKVFAVPAKIFAVSAKPVRFRDISASGTLRQAAPRARAGWEPPAIRTA